MNGGSSLEGRQVCHVARAAFGCLALLLSLAISTSRVVAAGAYEASGKLTYFDGDKIPRKHFLFSFYSDAVKWHLEVHEDGKTNQFGHCEYAFDGTNQYFVEYGNTRPLAEVMNTHTNADIVNGTVTKTRIPCDFSMFPHVYWMAFRAPIDMRPKQLPAGFVYMTKGIREPEWVKNIDDWTIPCRYVFDESNSNLLSEIVVRNPGVQYGFRGKTYPLDPPFDKGHTVASFQIVSRTNIDDQSIASVFVWSIFKPKSDGVTSNDLETTYFCEGRVTQVSAVPELASITPTVPSGVSINVKDYRYLAKTPSTDPAAAYYVSTTGFLQPVDKEFTRQANYQSKVNSIIGQRKFGRLLVALAVVASGIFIFFGFKRKPAAPATQDLKTE
jgi:hypothetical protein